MFSPMPTSTASSGPSRAPATAASIAPSTKITANSRSTRTPMTAAISRSLLPARTSMPVRVRATSR